MRNKQMDYAVERFNRICEEKAKDEGLTVEEYKGRLFDEFDKLPKANPSECEEYLKAQLIKI